MLKIDHLVSLSYQITESSLWYGRQRHHPSVFEREQGCLIQGSQRVDMSRLPHQTAARRKRNATRAGVVKTTLTFFFGRPGTGYVAGVSCPRFRSVS